MTAPNPYAPPKAAVADAPQPSSRLPRYVIAALVALQCLAGLRYWPAYFELVQTGASPLLALLLCALGSACLYIGTAFLLFRRSRAWLLLLLASASFGLSVPLWHLPVTWTFVPMLGAALGAVGCWVARHAVRAERLTQAKAGSFLRGGS